MHIIHQLYRSIDRLKTKAVTIISPGRRVIVALHSQIVSILYLNQLPLLVGTACNSLPGKKYVVWLFYYF